MFGAIIIEAFVWTQAPLANAAPLAAEVKFFLDANQVLDENKGAFTTFGLGHLAYCVESSNAPKIQHTLHFESPPYDARDGKQGSIDRTSLLSGMRIIWGNENGIRGRHLHLWSDWIEHWLRPIAMLTRSRVRPMRDFNLLGSTPGIWLISVPRCLGKYANATDINRPPD